MDKIPIEKAKSFKQSDIRRIEIESGAKIEIDKSKKQAVISGNEEERADAKILLEKRINGKFNIPTVGFVILDLDNLVIDSNKVKFEFVRFDGKDLNLHSKSRDKYYVRLINGTNHLAKSFSNNSKLLNGGFTTSKQIDDCLSKIILTLANVGSANLEKKEFPLKFYFGRELFSNIEKETFSASEWIKFRRTSRGKYSKNCTSFQHYTPQFLQKLDILQKHFKLEEKDVEVEDKGTVSIYFRQGLGQGKIDLHCNDKGLWEVTKYAHITDRLAILDIISGNEAPDCRLSLKIRCNRPVTRDIQKIINEIQFKENFDLKDGMWFRVKDFKGKFDKVEVRQINTKRRFSHKNFQISIADVIKDSKNGIMAQKTVYLENENWKFIENRADQNPRSEEIKDTIYETIRFAGHIMKFLS